VKFGASVLHTTPLSVSELGEHLRREGRDILMVLAEIMFTGVL
jgi:hypothetical protein